MSPFAWAALVPAIIAFVAIAALRRSSWAVRLADRPNQRSLHVDPTPRIGGLGIAAGIAPFAACAGAPALATMLGCALFLLAVSLADDFSSLPIEVRLPAHAGAALVAVLAASSPAQPWPWGWMGVALAVVAIVWAANLYNFMDGADGLAGGMGAIGFAALAIAALDAGQSALATLCAAIASACTGFLLHNFPPARVFMGDCGAIPLGFLAGALGLHGVLSGAWPAWFAPLIFSPFIVDATITLARRVWRREPFWRAHRDHGYQRLVLAGWSKRRLAIASWALMLAAAASALAARASSERERCAIIFIWLAVYALLVAAVGWRTRRNAQAARVESHPTPRKL
jgi:UDP-N-acetylmuramyl pentapeptide phosphotransferase/UDP-N-acetylglucosamine-1-phosphate transferase